MAEDYAPLFRSIWSDDDFRALTGGAQRLYLALLSSPNRNAAGVIGLTPRKWVRGAADLTAAAIDDALTELDGTGFLVVDDDTEEVLVRSYIRRAKVFLHIRLLVRALAELEAVESVRLRSALGQELVRLPRLAVPAATGTTRNAHMIEEAEAAQRRVDELASMLCDAPPETVVHPMPHGMGHGMPHGMGIGTGTGTGVGTGSVLGSSTSRDLESHGSSAGARAGSGIVVQGRWAL